MCSVLGCLFREIRDDLLNCLLRDLVFFIAPFDSTAYTVAAPIRPTCPYCCLSFIHYAMSVVSDQDRLRLSQALVDNLKTPGLTSNNDIYKDLASFQGNSGAKGSASHSVMEDSIEYWNGVAGTVNGMLGGFEEITVADCNESLCLLDELHATNGLSYDGAVLDVGAGIGRVSKGVLSQRFSTVDLLEPVAPFLQQVQFPAMRYKINGSYQTFDFRYKTAQCEGPACDEGALMGPYECVWIQWSAGYADEVTLAKFLENAALSVKSGGYIILKENINPQTPSGRDFWHFDEDEPNLVRSAEMFRRIIRAAGLTLVFDRRCQFKGYENADNLMPVYFFVIRV